MDKPLANALLAAGIPIILALVRVLGTARASVLAILGAYLILPSYGVAEDHSVAFTLDKATVAGASLLAGMVLFDRRGLLGFRPRWVDLPMLVYILSSLPAAWLGDPANRRSSIDESWIRLAAWGVPYLIGRAYFGDRESLRRLAVAIVVAGLCYIPACLWEMTLGTEWFLRPWVFGIEISKQMTVRLGGYRPDACLSTGIELSVWMASATVLAAWAWAARQWEPRWIPSWLPMLALLAVTIACRGAYGYALLLIGLPSVAATRLFGTRLVLMALLLVPPAYIGSRVAGIWDGRSLASVARLVDARSAGSVGVRLQEEDQYIRDAIPGAWAFGHGRVFDDHADGLWILLLRGGGLLGLAAHYAAFLLPAALVAFRRSTRPVGSSIEPGLALFAILQAIDSLHNRSMIAPLTLIGGGLASLHIAGSRGSGPSKEPPGPAREGGHATYRVGEAAAATVDRAEALGPASTVLAIGCLLYLFGHVQVPGMGGMKFVGGLGAALFFAASGAAAAGPLRHDPARAVACALAFAAMGISFNLALHPATRPTWSADILQGMALSGLLVALWRPRSGGSASWAFAGLAAVAASWWAFGESWRPFPGSQYLFPSGGPDLSPFPVAPWLAIAAVGAALAGTSAATSGAMAVGFGLAAALAWRGDWPFGAPSKTPLNATYALLGAAAASAAFAASGPLRGRGPSRRAADWLGRRWLAFFYIHMGLAVALGRLGLVQPGAALAALAVLSIAASWLVVAATDPLAPWFRRPRAWVAVGSAIGVVGLVPGLPPVVVQGVAGGVGLVFAARSGDLATLLLGPPVAEPRPVDPPTASERARYLARLALVAVALLGPELAGRLPSPIGRGRPPAAVDGPKP